MIAKDLDTVSATDRRLKAGHDAETQLAFYLKRAFAAEAHVVVLNGLRLEHEGDAAQIDHLVLHPHGFVIVESKSVVGSVEVNPQGEWARVYGGRRQGMPSPKLQADRQAAFLRRYLDGHAGRVVKGKALAALPIDVLVAVSDGGLIRRPGNDPLAYLVKADQVPGRIADLVAARRPAGGLLGLFRGGAALSAGELAGLTVFLRDRHRPVRQTAVPAAHAEPARPTPAAPPAPPAPTTTTSAYGCKTCQSERLEVRWGRYNYYFKCLDCGGNTAILRRCGGCGQEERVRRAGREFFGECGPCGRSERFHVNP